ncbi:MAG: hypothetical protein D8M59_07560 [Planctomycetes bacterium]|nr:hypothetical protein [Planctomycetota bacterium]NOG53184.1 hypothetical protein [Planctomycetota bacterium]
MNRFTFPDWGLFAGLFHTLLPDFMLAFTFFTALIYAVLGKRFDRGRTAAAMAIALGLALSTGLVWWESQHGYSIRDLGPVAIIFAVIMLALVLFQAIRHQGGSFAGVAIALAICLLILWVLGLGLPAPAETVGSVFLLALVFGIIAFLIHHHRYCPPETFAEHSWSHRLPIPDRTVAQTPARAEQRSMYSDIKEIDTDRRLGRRLWRDLKILRRSSEFLSRSDPPDTERVDFVRQIRRLLPAEGWLTDRLAQLRAKAYRIRKGHVAKLEETKTLCEQLPSSARKRASQDLRAAYREMVGIDQRLERLDRSVAEFEKRIRLLTAEAERAARQYEYQKVEDLLKRAERLQKHNAHLLKIIERTEEKLTRAARKVALQAQEVSRA